MPSRSFDPAEVKACCSMLYEQEWMQFLLGESYHPGGLALTDRLAVLTNIKKGQQILDVAAGTGTTALHLAQRFHCNVTGVDLSPANVEKANMSALDARLDHQVHFQSADAERLPFVDNEFDVVLSECSLCTFPDKTEAMAEMVRVTKSGGIIGMSDVTRSGALAPELDSVLGMAACVADAKSADEYCALFADAGLVGVDSERHNDAVKKLLEQIRQKLVGLQLLVGTGQIAFEAFDMQQARRLLREASIAAERGHLGYAIVLGRREQQQ